MTDEPGIMTRDEAAVLGLDIVRALREDAFDRVNALLKEIEPTAANMRVVLTIIPGTARVLVRHVVGGDASVFAMPQEADRMPPAKRFGARIAAACLNDDDEMVQDIISVVLEESRADGGVLIVDVIGVLVQFLHRAVWSFEGVFEGEPEGDRTDG